MIIIIFFPRGSGDDGGGNNDNNWNFDGDYIPSWKNSVWPEKKDKLKYGVWNENNLRRGYEEKRPYSRKDSNKVNKRHYSRLGDIINDKFGGKYDK